MASKSEIQSWIWNARNTYDRYQRIIDDCNKKIARLEPVYNKLSDIKSDFKKARRSTKDIFREKGEWRGRKYNSFCREGDSLDGSMGDYYRQLDIAHDAINSKIGELRAKKRELIPLLGSLLAQIEVWNAEKKNALN